MQQKFPEQFGKVRFLTEKTITVAQVALNPEIEICT
jgi:hypothetical protein